MKKLLLTLATAALFTAAQAEEFTVDMNSVADTDLTGGEWTEETYKADGSVQAAKNYKPVASLTVDGFTFTVEQGEGSAPAFYYSTSTSATQQKSLRMYVNNSFTLTAPEGVTMRSITFNGQKIAFTSAATVSNGEFTLIKSSQAVWAGETNALTVNLDGTIRIESFTVSTEADEEPVIDNTLMLNAEMANGFDGWIIDNIDLEEGLEYVWQWKSYNGAYYLNGSAYAGGAKTAEAIAMSPIVDLTKAEAAVCKFEHAAKFQTTLRTLCGFVAREEGAQEWTSLEIPTWPEAGAWTWAESGAIDLAAFVGKKVQLGFRYGSNANGADTWEVRNLKLDITAGAASAIAEENAAVEIFNLQGIRQQGDLTPGLYIRRQGQKVEKVVVK